MRDDQAGHRGANLGLALDVDLKKKNEFPDRARKLVSANIVTCLDQLRSSFRARRIAPYWSVYASIALTMWVVGDIFIRVDAMTRLYHKGRVEAGTEKEVYKDVSPGVVVVYQ